MLLRHAPPRRARLPIAAAALLLAAPRAAGAQWIGVAGEDALVVRRGVVRVSVQGRLEGWDERFTSGPDGAPASERVPLGGPLSSPSLGAAQMPSLRPIETRLRTLTGQPTLELSLGDVRVQADARRSSVPVRLDLGIGGRLAISAMVPYVQTRVSAVARANPDATGGNVGLNPALADAAAAATNASVVTQLRSAAAALRAQLAGCTTTPTAPVCAQSAAAAQLTTAADAYANDLAAVYGVTGTPGAGVVPLVGSPAATAVAGRIAAIGTEFRGFGVDVVPAGAAPRGAAAPLSGPQLAAATGDGSLGLGLREIGEARRYGIGDVEVGARFRLLDPYGGDPRRQREAGSYVRAAVGALYRFGTGDPDDPTDLLDVGVGDGQDDIEVMAAADIVTGRRFATLIAARYGVQMKDERELLVPEEAGAAYSPAENIRLLERDLGDYLELEIAPRIAVGRFLAVGAHYHFRSKAEDAYDLVGGDGDPIDGDTGVDPTLLALGTETREQLAGVSVVLNTIPAFAAGGSRLPIEVSYRYLHTLGGGGRLATYGSRSEVTVRVLTELFGRRR